MSVKVNFDLGKMARATPKIMALLINDVGALVITDTIEGVSKGVDQSGRRFAPLSPVTIKIKKAKGSPEPNRALWDTGRMVEGMFVKVRATPAKLNALVALARDRDAIGIYHHLGKGRNPVREWFPTKQTPRLVKRMAPLLRSTERKIVKSVR